MIPTVTQQLESMRDAMARYVLPALPSDPFVQEEAGLVFASLEWLIDINEYQHTVEQVECADARTLARALLEIAALGEAAPAEAIRKHLDAPPPTEAPLEELREHSRALKALSACLLEAAPAQCVADASALFAQAARRLVEREQSWCRMTGLPQDVSGPIAEVLRRQVSEPFLGRLAQLT